MNYKFHLKRMPTFEVTVLLCYVFANSNITKEIEVRDSMRTYLTLSVFLPETFDFSCEA